MNLGLLVSVLRARAQLRSHDRWSRAELRDHQARGLRELRRFATARSPFYRELHRGYESAPLDELPVVTKSMVMERFDELVTDRSVRLAEVETYLEHAAATDLFRGSDRVAASDVDCPDGLPYALLAGIEGREEEVLTLAGTTVHPNVFHNVLETLAGGGWQVIEEDECLRVLLAGAPTSVDPATVRDRLDTTLRRLGVQEIRIQVERVDAIPRTALGKAPLVRRAGRSAVTAAR